jgi:hypothetical protein
VIDRCTHLSKIICLIIFVFFSSCDQHELNADKSQREMSAKSDANRDQTEPDYPINDNDIVFAEWFAVQAFSIEVIRHNDNNEPIFTFSGFSIGETRAEDVIDIQRKSIEKFIDYRGEVPKFEKLGVWFENQLKAEQILFDFVTSKLFGKRDISKIISETVVDSNNVLSRQTLLLEMIRSERIERHKPTK